jgi:O-antigen/teichoic acid export membrane protein
MAVEETMRPERRRLKLRRIGALAATAVVAGIVTFLGVFYFFEPISAADPVSAPPVPASVGFLVYIILSVLLLDWVSRQIGRPIKAALIIAASQIILVSIDFVLRGERGVATGAASAVLILATWTIMGAVYGAVLSATKPAGDSETVGVPDS